jgi:hypothetical protein
MLKNSITFGLVLLLAAVPLAAMLAQDAGELTLRLNRDFGYAGFGIDIQGTFSIIAEGPDSLREVRFLIDGDLVAVDSEAPFRTQFNTDAFPPGIHHLSAEGTLTDDSTISSNRIEREFLSNEQVNESMKNLLAPVLGLVVVFMLIGVLGPMLMNRKSGKPAVGQYGMAGGAVCKQCGLPFSRKMLSPNLLLGKLERCPHCGKWQLSARAWGETLSAAEDRLRAAQSDGGSAEVGLNEDERLRRQLDESKFDD